MSQLPDRPDLARLRRQPPGAPDFLTADAGELIDGQYADRPQLRPILDAVLALLPALGPATVQARGLIRRAYDENTAPPSPRRPARRPGAVAGTITVAIEGSELPGRSCRPEPDGTGHENVHVALGGRSEDRISLTMSNKPGVAIEPVPGDALAARWEMPVTVRRDDDGFDFAGRTSAASGTTGTSG